MIASMLSRNRRPRCNARTAFLFTSAALALGGCATTYPLMPTPVLYTGTQAKQLFTTVPSEQRAPLDLLYITDRVPATGPDPTDPYTANRSRSMAFGSTTVEFGDDISWDALVSQSTLVKRTTELNLKPGPTKELGRYPRVPYRIAETSTGLSRDPAYVDEHEKANRALQDEVARRLAVAPRKEVVMFVHGYANTFEHAALTMGELCHFLGREFVCAIFSWPAGGNRGGFLGYDVDRESSEFAVEHLRKVIRTIADTPGLEKIHLIAHSRGTDVLVTAVSDLGAEVYITKTTLAHRFKIGNIVLIAPDIDADVAPTKIFKVFSDPDMPYGGAPAPRVRSLHRRTFTSRCTFRRTTRRWPQPVGCLAVSRGSVASTPPGSAPRTSRRPACSACSRSSRCARRIVSSATATLSPIRG
jgi:esterase/lipase superfamily enzyme